MNIAARFLSMVLAGAALTACSGGGGGGGFNPPPAPAELAEITSTNAGTIAGAALVASLEGGDLGALAVLGATTGALTTQKTTKLYAKIADIQAKQTASLFKQHQAGYMQAAFGPEEAQCTVSGTLTLSGDIANQQTLSPGDTITLAFADCDDGVTVVDGSFSLRINTFSGDVESGSFSLSVTLTLTAFQVEEAGEVVAANGDISVSVNTLTSPQISVTVASSSLAISGAGASHTLDSFSLTQTVNDVTGQYSLESSGTLESSDFDGAVEFETVEPFTGDGAGHPGGGELLITGANGATIRVIVLDTTFLQLELDIDGDGTLDEVIDSTWDALT